MPGFSHKQRKKTNGRVVKEDSESNAGGGGVGKNSVKDKDGLDPEPFLTWGTNTHTQQESNGAYCHTPYDHPCVNTGSSCCYEGSSCNRGFASGGTLKCRRNTSYNNGFSTVADSDGCRMLLYGDNDGQCDNDSKEGNCCKNLENSLANDGKYYNIITTCGEKSGWCEVQSIEPV